MGHLTGFEGAKNGELLIWRLDVQYQLQGYFEYHSNGMAYLPPRPAGLLTHRSTKIGKLCQQTHAGGGQMKSALVGKANLDYIKPHSFSSELPT